MTKLRRTSKKSPALLAHGEHARLWALVEGAVVDAFVNHLDYLTDKGVQCAVQSITKRVVGTLVGHAQDAQRSQDQKELRARLGEQRTPEE
jgi:hypothetical protein